MLEKVKLALRITTSAFDSELSGLIDSAKLDLGVAGVVNISDYDQLVITAIISYCKCHFGDPDTFDRWKRIYDEQKAQMSTSTAYNQQ